MSLVGDTTCLCGDMAAPDPSYVDLVEKKPCPVCRTTWTFCQCELDADLAVSLARVTGPLRAEITRLTAELKTAVALNGKWMDEVGVDRQRADRYLAMIREYAEADEAVLNDNSDENCVRYIAAQKMLIAEGKKL